MSIHVSNVARETQHLRGKTVTVETQIRKIKKSRPPVFISNLANCWLYRTVPSPPPQRELCTRGQELYFVQDWEKMVEKFEAALREFYGTLEECRLRCDGPLRYTRFLDFAQVCVYVCVCVCVCVCMYKYMCAYCMCVCVHVCVYTSVHLCLCVCECEYVGICVHGKCEFSRVVRARWHTHTYTHTHTHTHAHMHTHTASHCGTHTHMHTQAMSKQFIAVKECHTHCIEKLGRFRDNRREDFFSSIFRFLQFGYC